MMQRIYREDDVTFFEQTASEIVSDKGIRG
jgi:hypothetical protein